MSVSVLHAPGTPPALTELLAGMSKISGHRQALIRLNWLLEDETRGAQDLVEVLRMDQGLSARVISAANTVLFRGGTPVASVEEAVVRVGVWEIRKMLLSSIMRELTQGPLRCYGLAPGDLWTRSLLSAISMDVLAHEANRSSDICYTVGLLHSVGLIVVDHWLTRPEATQVVRIGPVDSPTRVENERAALGWTAEELGAALLESWKFSEGVVAAVRHQGAPAGAGRFRGLAALVALARWQARAIEAEAAFRPKPPRPEASVIAYAGLEESRLVALLGVVKETFVKSKAQFGAI